ncbi:MAG: DUF3823 domain-containing protein [Prevotella sp.]|jgi:hypothetical protein|nr:DUF3823 domain-containing protein [Prevotella sp.]MCH3992646.1 DUF3823 domain-containing protein [Prevotella sp.]MCH4099239.1 DUF3823 domain-containing protein [Prevotella sp.]MCI1371327.1 DUF3823 domain-containing protein [Prevotella sp.]MCI1472964.1 DUF3823 domain-containing protein [Prevotella sp.]
MNKKVFYILFLSSLLLASCDMFEMDNYDAPDATIKGAVVDDETGDSILTDQGSEGIRVRMLQLDYSDNAQHNPDFYCMPNGTFQNTKEFKGRYNVTVDGPFIPIVRENSSGIPIADGSQIVNLKGKGTTNVVFKVKPFLEVEFVGYPTVSNGIITAKVKVVRRVSRTEFQSLIEPMGGYDDSYPNITDIQLFVSYSSTVGYRARDERWSNHIDYSGSSFDDLLGTPVTITSAKGAAIPSGRHVFIRAAARINYDTPKGSGTRRWNYSKPMEVIIP